MHKDVRSMHVRRWLVARTWNIDKAEHSLQEHATWRAEFPNNSVSEVSKCQNRNLCFYVVQLFV